MAVRENKNGLGNLKKGIILVFIANLINLIISLVNGFVLPKYLSVETFAEIKTFQLYINYVGILHLGYSDGIYLSYGGKQFLDIPGKEINVCRSNLLIFQGCITLLGTLVAVFLNDYVLLLATLCILPLNIVATYKSLLQATGEFGLYSRVLNYASVLNFVGSIALLFLFRTDNGYLYIGWNVMVSFLIWCVIEFKLMQNYHIGYEFYFSLKNLLSNIKSGIVLMLGNFSSILMTSIDRWFVKGLLTTADFAYYSFVVSVENLIAIFITPVVTTMYNYICKVTDLTSIKKIKKTCLLFSVFLISSAFPAKFILETYLVKYLASQYVLFILFATEIFYMVIKGIYVNIYKARKQQSLYLKQLIVVIIIGTVLNGAAYFINHSNEAIALATLVSVIIWYFICCVSVKEILPDWKENLMLIIVVPLFIGCGCFLPSILGFVIYIIAAFILSFVLMKESLYDVVELAMSIIKRKKA